MISAPKAPRRRSSLTRELIDSSRPRWPGGVLLEATPNTARLFLTADSRVVSFEGNDAGAFHRAWEEGDTEALDRMAEDAFGPFAKHPSPSGRNEESRVRALSLAVAQKCNLGCTYCYANEGDFGGPARHMDLETATASVDRLLDDTRPGERANLAFMGGEPLTNRAVLYEATDYASRRAKALDVELGFSITTNGTLLKPEDADFLERHGFAVTISLDGTGADHDNLRPTKGGAGTYERIMENVAPLLARQHDMQVSARATVTPSNLRLRETLDEFISLGFHSVGFSPMLSSPNGSGEMDATALDRMLTEMVVCGLSFEKAVCDGQRYPFLNMVNAMREIHRGAHRTLPCGAGDGYFGVSADGDLFACHRFVDDPERSMGDLSGGVDHEARSQWLAQRQVDTQEPCRSCWARYLCGGGCHHEVINRGRPACDFIRGWLKYCLAAHDRLSRTRPDYFGIDRP